MYIAFKWLVGLALTMWVAICGLDLYLMRIFKVRDNYADASDTIFEFPNVNFTTEPMAEQKLALIKNIYTNEKEHGFIGVHCFMFISGALAVAILHRKKEIINYTKNKIPIVSMVFKIEKVAVNFNLDYSKKTAKICSVAVVKYYQFIWIKIKNLSHKLMSIINDWAKSNKRLNQQKINLLLLNKLKEIGKERRDLGQLLIAALHENKNIRMHYQLESMAKNRLVQHIESIQKQIKENRSKYISFQQLYLVTHQENTYLKARIRKLSKDKEDAQKDLIDTINKVYRSKNQELKAYCCRFIVKTKDNLLNSDVSAEIHKFLHKPREPVPSTPNAQFSGNDLNTDLRQPKITEVLQGDYSLVPLESDAPKLKGLPGEYVWTVKDKHGLIEKLYEYDHESNINRSDTIRRIRQYSVYYDKDCLLDFSNQKTATSQTILQASTTQINKFNVEFPLSRQKFLTGSEAFQKFLQNNINTVLSPKICEPHVTRII